MSSILSPFEYLEPQTVDGTVRLLSKYGTKAKVLAGGTDLLVLMKRKAIRPQYVVNIKGIRGLDYIQYSPRDGLKIGALAKLQSLADSPVIKDKYGLLVVACDRVCTPQVRNMATIGGNLCQDTRCPYYSQFGLWGKDPCHRAGGNVCYAVKGAKRCLAMATQETAAALICLGAEVCIAGSKGERTIPLENFFISSGVVDLREDEILTEIKIPKPLPNTGGAYLRYSVRETSDFTIAGVAVMLTVNSGVFDDVRIGLLGVARTPLRAHKAEEILNGQKIEGDLIDQAAQTAMKIARPLGDIFASAAYRRKLVNVLAKRAIKQALDAAQKPDSP